MKVKGETTQLGREILDIIREKETTIVGMAKELRISDTQLRNIIHGRSFPSKELLANIEIKFGKKLMFAFFDKS